MRRGSGRCLRASARRHIEQIVAHAMLDIGVLQQVVVDHDHFVVILFRHGKSFAVPIDLMRQEVPERTIGIDFGDSAEERLVCGLILQRHHEQLVMSVGIGKLDATIHVELQGCGED